MTLNLNEFKRGYFWCAAFTEQPEFMSKSGEFTWEMAERVIALMLSHVKYEMRRDCERFMARFAYLIEPGEELDAGMYFWYDRNGHGTGAWDHEDTLGERAELLADAGKSFGGYDGIDMRNRDLLGLLFDQLIIMSADHYSEPGYDDPKKGCLILFANWNPVPDEFVEALEEAGHKIEWSDEWATCENCNGAVRVSGDCYGWQRSFYMPDDCIVVCATCALENDETIEDYLTYVRGHADRAVTFDLYLRLYGYRQLNKDYMTSGFHSGQNDSPEVVAENLKKVGVTDFIFKIDGAGQFDVNWSVWVRDDCKLAEMVDAYQGYDTATEMGNALKGLSSKHVKVTTRQVSGEEFVSGIGSGEKPLKPGEKGITYTTLERKDD